MITGLSSTTWRDQCQPWLCNVEVGLATATTPQPFPSTSNEADSAESRSIYSTAEALYKQPLLELVAAITASDIDQILESLENPRWYAAGAHSIVAACFSANAVKLAADLVQEKNDLGDYAKVSRRAAVAALPGLTCQWSPSNTSTADIYRDLALETAASIRDTPADSAATSSSVTVQPSLLIATPHCLVDDTTLARERAVRVATAHAGNLARSS